MEVAVGMPQGQHKGSEPRTSRVTIGIPTHNGRRTIARTIDSVAAQTFRNFKLVVSENASTDGTKSYITGLGDRFDDFKVIHQTTLISAEANFRAVLSDCDTEYFVWLADDDWWEPDFLEECVRLLNSESSVVTAFTNFRVYYHFLDLYSDEVGYVASASYDPRLNVYTRAANMAPCAIYGVHRTFAIKAAMARLSTSFDFHDVAVTLEMAAKGQLLLSKRDLFRAGVVEESRLQRKSLDGGQLRYMPLARFVTNLVLRTFGWKSGGLIAPELLFQLYKVKRHNDLVHGRPSKLDPTALKARSEVEDRLPSETAEQIPVPDLPGYIRRLADESGIDVGTVHFYNSATRDAWMSDRAASVATGSKVLDVGAGTGPYKSLFAHCLYETHDFAQYDGFKGPEGTYAKIDYVSDINAIPVPDGAYDVILCTEVLEHVPRPIEALAEMVRIVKPGGRLFLSAPLGSGLHQEPYHFYGGYTDHWYRRFLEEFGCDVEAIEPNHGWFAHLAQECARFSWTFERHRHLHGEHGGDLSEFMGSTLARYLYALDEKVFMREFTVGFHVTARKRVS